MIDLEISEGVAFITVNAPATRNALNNELAAQFVEACDEADGDGSVGAAVIKGAGGTFCSGAERGHLDEVGRRSRWNGGRSSGPCGGAVTPGTEYRAAITRAALIRDQFLAAAANHPAAHIGQHQAGERTWAAVRDFGGSDACKRPRE